MFAMKTWLLLALGGMAIGLSACAESRPVRVAQSGFPLSCVARGMKSSGSPAELSRYAPGVFRTAFYPVGECIELHEAAEALCLQVIDEPGSVAIVGGMLSVRAGPVDHDRVGSFLRSLEAHLDCPAPQRPVDEGSAINSE